VLAALVAADELPAKAADVVFKVERPKRAEHGDMATNVALVLQKIAKRPPRQIAELLAAQLKEERLVREVDIAGPGFLNLHLQPGAFQRVLADVLRNPSGFGRGPAASKGRVMVEFVSANPTGPLLISHGRGALVGDAVASLLEAAGYHVSREYYINDFGNQVRLFAASVRAAAQGQPPPEGGYGGGYVGELAAWVQSNQAELLDGDDDALSRVCITRMLDGVSDSDQLGGIKASLAALNVKFDSWFSEESLHRWGRVDACLNQLREASLLEERDGALFVKTEQLGDDKDRVVRKSDGAFTYFASDIAYQADKYARGYDRLILVLGADHHGYEARLRAAIKGLGQDDDRFEILFFQLVSLLRDGKPYKMGKRLGNLITIDEVLEEIDEAAQRPGAGADALRYFYLSRHFNNTIDIDIELAKKSSLDNPVFYLQMGYARLCSIQRRAEELFGLQTPACSERLCARIEHPDELAMLGHLAGFPRVVAEAAEAREPHRVVFFLRELSQSFQSYFTRLKKEGDAILPLGAQMKEADWEQRWDKEKTLARLLWVRAIQIVYGAGLKLLGISALSRMEPLDDRASTDEESK